MFPACSVNTVNDKTFVGEIFIRFTYNVGETFTVYQTSVKTTKLFLLKSFTIFSNHLLMRALCTNYTGGVCHETTACVS